MRSAVSSSPLTSGDSIKGCPMPRDQGAKRPPQGCLVLLRRLSCGARVTQHHRSTARIQIFGGRAPFCVGQGERTR